MIKSSHIFNAILVIASLSTSVQAQDILNTTGQTVRSYNYVEGFYLVNLEDRLPANAKVDTPALFRVSLDLLDNLALVGEYADQSYELTANGIPFEGKSVVYELSLRYRGELTLMQDTDWIAGITYGSIDAELNSIIQNFENKDNFYGTHFGARRTLTDRLELGVGINLTRLRSGGSFSGSGEATLVYRLANRLDIALGGTNLTESDIYGVGLRYTWN